MKVLILFWTLIVVADTDNKLINIFSPRCLSVDKAGHLLVCAFESGNIQVFELSGKFITRFGRSGSKIGEFVGPTSTAVLTDGRIVVCDFCNNRIQIFE